jgi:predicted signal transduction protein with EAL and GGDEF domain
VRPDRVKIDQKLVAPLETNPSQILILKALARVAALEGCGVVVEGIETQKQLNAILQLECEALKGFILARPMAESAFAKMLVASRSGAQAGPDVARSRKTSHQSHEMMGTQHVPRDAIELRRCDSWRRHVVLKP